MKEMLKKMRLPLLIKGINLLLVPNKKRQIIFDCKINPVIVCLRTSVSFSIWMNDAMYWAILSTLVVPFPESIIFSHNRYFSITRLAL